jgi:hypothetical protein
MQRLGGVLLFLPVPLVLWLFTRMPYGAWISIGAGIAIVATHRLYARPWALARKDGRCFWCGATAPGVLPIEVSDPLGPVAWAACSPAHRALARRTLGYAQRHAWSLRVGILGALAAFVVAAPLAWSGRLGGFTHRDAVNLFRLSVALAVLPLGWLGPDGPEPVEGPLRVPFPTHVQALIGTRAVTWLFRLVGIAWLVVSARALLARL